MNSSEEKTANQKIIRERKSNGESWRDIAKTHEVRRRFTERWVRKLGNDTSDQHPTRQQALFEIPPSHYLNVWGGSYSSG